MGGEVLTQRRKGAKTRRKRKRVRSFFLKYPFASLPLCVFALKIPRSALFILAAIFATTLGLRAETIAILTPDHSEASIQFATDISERLGTRLRVLDPSLAETAYLSSPPVNPFNITSAEAMRVGTVIGCDAFV